MPFEGLAAAAAFVLLLSKPFSRTKLALKQIHGRFSGLPSKYGVTRVTYELNFNVLYEKNTMKYISYRTALLVKKAYS